MSDDVVTGRFNSIVETVARRVETMLVDSAPVRDILARLTAAAEQVAGKGSAASILLLDKDGLLRNAASPNLPADYLDAIDRLRPDPAVGTCAAAAATGEIVQTPDFHVDTKWAELKHLPIAIGYRGAWSMPIKDSSGRVLGTFGTYYREEDRVPRQEEMDAVAKLVALAAETLAQKSFDPVLAQRGSGS